MGLRQILGLDYFQALAKMNPQFIVQSEQTAERLVNARTCWPGAVPRGGCCNTTNVAPT